MCVKRVICESIVERHKRKVYLGVFFACTCTLDIFDTCYMLNLLFYSIRFTIYVVLKLLRCKCEILKIFVFVKQRPAIHKYPPPFRRFTNDLYE